MGQYWNPVNLDKREFIDPHKLGSGVKLCEQLATSPGVGSALIILCSAMPEPRGGGDFDLAKNWHGRERVFPEHNTAPGPMPEAYPAIAKRTIGRWAGDRIALLGDYSESGDLALEHQADKIYGLCLRANGISDEDLKADGITRDELFTDVTDDVAAVIEHELRGRFTGDGWKRWVDDE